MTPFKYDLMVGFKDLNLKVIITVIIANIYEFFFLLEKFKTREFWVWIIDIFIVREIHLFSTQVKLYSNLKVLSQLLQDLKKTGKILELSKIKKE